MPSTAELLDEIARREKKFERAKAIGDKYAPKFAGTRAKYQPPLAHYTMESGWIPDPREQSAPNFNEGLAAVGLRWRKHEIVVDRWKPPSMSKATAIDKTMRTKYAACAALGLSYWCDGFHGHIIAVDAHPRFVYVKINQKERTVLADGRSGVVVFTVGDTDATLDLLAADQPLPEPLFLAEKPKEISRLIIQSAVAHIRHDGSYVTDTETAVLQTIVDKAKYFTGARDIVPLITAELKRRVAA